MFCRNLSCAILLLPFFFSQASAHFLEFFINDREEGGKTVKAIWLGKEGRLLSLTSATSEMKEEYRDTLRQLPLKEGYPAVENADTAFEHQNVQRQLKGNPFHLYRVSLKGEEIPPTFIQFGRMPAKGYAEGTATHSAAHHPIIEKWIELGVTRHKDSDGGSLGDDNIERIENRGLATFIPLFKAEVENATLKEDVIEASYHLISELRTRGFLLPVEDTFPHVVVGILDPADPLLPLYERNGFTRDENSGFGWFYPKDDIPQPRVMVTRLLSMGADIE